jgi:transcriptional regulator with XRE-family HTH domain
VRTDETGLGAVIKAARLEKGLTQEALAEIAGVGLRHIMSIENEGRYPSYEVLYKLIRELNIPADTIFYPEKQHNSPEAEKIIPMLYLSDERSLKVIRATAQASLDSQPKE